MNWRWKIREFINRIRRSDRTMFPIRMFLIYPIAIAWLIWVIYILAVKK